MSTDISIPSMKALNKFKGDEIHRSASHEALSAHPLLSPGPPSPKPSNTSPDSKSAAAPNYLPYTPRQRVPIGSVTTGTALSSPISASPSPQRHQGNATSKLQLQNLKAATQNIGLDVGSLGWVMLEELVSGHDHGPTWNELWATITSGKATLLLPLEPANPHDIITPDFFKDHIIFCNGAARNNSPVVTLSGLRGYIDDGLTIVSTVSPTSKLFQPLVAPTTRASALLSLPPLPKTDGPATYPKFSVPSYSASLPMPPRAIFPSKPPLPPRPGSRPPVAAASRLSNPFASLFTKSPAQQPFLLPPTAETPAIDHVVEVSAFTIDRPIIRRDIAKAISKAIKTHIKDSLHGVPSWVVDRVQSFTANLHPIPKSYKNPRDTDGSDLAPPYSVPTNDEPPADVESSFQSFYASLEHDICAATSSSVLRKREERSKGDHVEKLPREQDQTDSETRTREILEKVERTVCSVFYDRLFRQPTSDDASHDEALSSRVAALNMLDLGLEHLGVDVGLAGPDVQSVITACGQTISQLEVARCPADKAAVLVAAHRIIVDGLSRLPPVRLISEDSLGDQRTPRAAAFSHKPAVNAETGKPDLDSAGASPRPEVVPIAPEVPTRLPETVPLLVPEIGIDIASDVRAETTQPSNPGSDELVVQVLPPAPLLTISPPATPTPVSGDILLPLIIFSVVKANPPQLVSHLLYTQRYRNQSFGGEENYCLINLMAVVEFLENVDLGALGLKESEKTVMSAADLTPIPLGQAQLHSDKTAVTQGIPASLRGRMEQQVDAITGSANKVLSGVTGVVDSSFGVLRAFLPANAADTPAEGLPTAPWNVPRPGFGLLRRESGFSIASLAASLPGRERSKSNASTHGEFGQEMVESRPGSIKDVYVDNESASERSDDPDEAEDSQDSEADGGAHDTKSIRSFESMMSGKSRNKEQRDRMSLTDRLANMSRLTRATQSPIERDRQLHNDSPPPSRLSTLLTAAPPQPTRPETPSSSRAPSPVPDVKLRIAPPNRRFLECSMNDIKVAEVAELLQDYRRVVDGMRALGGFEE